MHGLGLGSNRGLYRCNAVWIGVDPFQTAALSHGLHVCHRQAERLDAWHAIACRRLGRRCCGLRFFTRCVTWGAVGALSETLALVNAEAFGRIDRMKVLLNGIAATVGFGPPWKTDVMATLSQIGCVILPDGVTTVSNIIGAAALSEALKSNATLTKLE